MTPDRYAAALALLLAAAPVAGEPVRIGADPHYPPFQVRNAAGGAEGFDVALLQAIARDEGFETEVVFGEWGQTLAALEQGELDVVPMFVSGDREARFRFSRPYRVRAHRLFGPPGEPVADARALAGRRVAVQFGGLAWEWLANRHVDAIVHPTNVESGALLAVREGRAEFALVPVDIGEDAIARFALQGIVPRSSDWLPADYAFGVRRDKPELAAALDRGLDRLAADGRLAALEQAWLTPLPAPGPAREWGWRAVLAAAAGLVALAGLAVLARRRLLSG